MSKKYQIGLIVICIGLMLSTILGISYAYWQITKKQTNQNNIASGCLDFEIINENNDIKLTNQYPIVDEEGMKLVPYTFTVKNTCSIFMSYTINLEKLKESTMNSEYLKAVINKNEIQNLATYENATPTIDGALEARTLINGSLGQEDEETYTLRIWMDEKVSTSEAMNKVFNSKITVSAVASSYSPVKYGITKLNEALIASEYQTTVERAKTKIAAKQEADFSKTAPIMIWQEEHNGNTSKENVILVDPSLIGTKIGTRTITKEDSLLLVGTGYTFDVDTGKYTLQNTSYVDPTTLDTTKTDYYHCINYINQGNDETIVVEHRLGCGELRKLVSSTKKTSGSGQEARIKYDETVYLYTQSESASDKSDKGLYKSSDDLGDVYYYRGEVNNNFVKFAGYYWRIIRTNGDGSVRLIYNGSTTDQYGATTQIGESPFNATGNNPGYSGYMYGKTFNQSYELTNKNEEDSTIKSKLDIWYKNNIVDKSYANYIVDAIYCNDRSLYQGNGYDILSTTQYGAYYQNIETSNPSLKCSQKNDQFSASNEIGNGALTYPVGLITADEMAMAGGVYSFYNRLFYLYTKQIYWAFTPAWFNSAAATTETFHVNAEGYYGYADAKQVFGIRPVITLNAKTEITDGIGTANNPFIIS